MDLWRRHKWRVLRQNKNKYQTGTRTEMESWSYLPHRRVAPAQSVHQLRRKPMSAVRKKREVIGSWSVTPNGGYLRKNRRAQAQDNGHLDSRKA